MMGFSDRGGISWTICKRSAPRSRQITTPTPHHSIFTGRMFLLTPNQQYQSTEGTGTSTFTLSKNTSNAACLSWRQSDVVDKFRIFLQLGEQLLLLLQNKWPFERFHHQSSRLRTHRVASTCTGVPQHWVFRLNWSQPDQLHSKHQSKKTSIIFHHMHFIHYTDDAR